MPYTLIKGTFRPDFGKPDGDSVRFVADDPIPFFRIKRAGYDPELSKNGSIQLRFEAIDSLEKDAIEPLASDATKSNLDLLGTENGTRESRGYVLCNLIGPFGRPIVFVFLGEPAQADHSSVFLDTDLVKESINYQQLVVGHAYPLFYDTLFDDLREVCRSASKASQGRGKGMWGDDVSTGGTKWTGDLSTLPPIFPKLWRRLSGYIKDEEYFNPDAPMRNLKAWIEKYESERVTILDTNIHTGFDNIIETTDSSLKLIYEPSDIVIVAR